MDVGKFTKTVNGVLFGFDFKHKHVPMNVTSSGFVTSQTRSSIDTNSVWLNRRRYQKSLSVRTAQITTSEKWQTSITLTFHFLNKRRIILFTSWVIWNFRADSGNQDELCEEQNFSFDWFVSGRSLVIEGGFEEN